MDTNKVIEDKELTSDEKLAIYKRLIETEGERLAVYKELTEDDKLRDDQQLRENQSLTNDERCSIDAGLTDIQRLAIYAGIKVQEMLEVYGKLTEDELLAIDEIRAMKQGCLFRIVTKAGRGMRWITVYENITPLSHALNLANGIEAYEVGIIANGPIYWTSKDKKTLNSTIFYS